MGILVSWGHPGGLLGVSWEYRGISWVQPRFASLWWLIQCVCGFSQAVWRFSHTLLDDKTGGSRQLAAAACQVLKRCQALNRCQAGNQPIIANQLRSGQGIGRPKFVQKYRPGTPEI